MINGVVGMAAFPPLGRADRHRIRLLIELEPVYRSLARLQPLRYCVRRAEWDSLLAHVAIKTMGLT
jgi:hypothetical protein